MYLTSTVLLIKYTVVISNTNWNTQHVTVNFLIEEC